MTLAAALDVAGTLQRDRVDRDAELLLGTRCGNCGADSWPARAVCHRCGRAAPSPHRFGPTGSLVTHTQVWTARPGLDVPYRLGQVRLDDGPAIFCHVRGLEPGSTVPLRVRLVIAPGEEDVPPFWFVPEEAGR